MPDSDETSWYHSPILLILAFAVFPPLGLYGLFRFMELSPGVSIVLVILIGSAGGQYSEYGFDVTAGDRRDSDSLAVEREQPEAAAPDAEELKVDSTE